MNYFGLCYGHFVYFTAIWYILRPFGIFYGHLVYFTVIWYIFSRFGMLYQVKSGNPVDAPFQSNLPLISHLVSAFGATIFLSNHFLSTKKTMPMCTYVEG
jgi:hypothetical protein